MGKCSLQILISKILVFIMLLIPCNLKYNKPIKDNELYSISAVLIDGDTGRVLYGKNENEERAMASTTKIMTLILALEYGNLNDTVTISEYAAKMPDVQMNVKAGEQYKLKDLLYAMIFESYNDVAVAIAEHVGGNVEEFADMMNQKAKEIGLSHTYFITPNGLDAKDEKGIHHTTAYELALIMRYCVMHSIKSETFIKICQSKNYTFCDLNNKRLFVINNKNRLLDMFEGVLAGKTGFTADSGYCYTGAVRFEDKTYIVALLGCGWPGNKGYKWSDSKKLLNYAKDNYDYKCLLDKNINLPYLKVSNGIEYDKINYIIEKDISAIVNEHDKIEIIKNLPEKINAPVYKDDIIGNITVKVNDYSVGCVNVYSDRTIHKRDYNYYLKKVIYKTLFR